MRLLEDLAFKVVIMLLNGGLLEDLAFDVISWGVSQLSPSSSGGVCAGGALAVRGASVRRDARGLSAAVIVACSCTSKDRHGET